MKAMGSQDLNKLNRRRGNLTLPEARAFMREDYTSIVKLVVRPQDIDSYGHMNNSCYIGYGEIGRRALQMIWDICEDDLLKKGIWTVTSGLQYFFKKPAEAGDIIYVYSAMLPYERGGRFYMAHKLKRGEDLIATAMTEHAFVYSNGKPLNPNHCDILEVNSFLDRLKEIS